MHELLAFIEILEELKTKSLQGQLEALDIQKKINQLSDEFVKQELMMMEDV
jgi:hypothetical protein